jgi:subtilisin family serine protease
VALDLPATSRDRANALGFRVVDQTALRSLDSTMTRLAVPPGMTAVDALDTLRAIDSKTHFDSAHYYGLLVGVAGTADGPAPQMSPRKQGSLRVGMIDTAVASHIALRGTAIEARDFTSGPGAVIADHGTAVASILAQEGSTRIVAANIFKGGDGRPFTSPDAIVRALEWMVSRDVGVINISLAGPRNDILDTLIARVVAKGHFVVAAAGNGGPAAPPAYPAAVPRVVAVTAVDKANRVYRYANQGDYIAFSATGVAVPAAAAHDSIAAFSGTSFASPHVAAELARCLQQARKRDGTRCLVAMQLAARDVGAPGRDPVYGYGVLD